MLEPVFIERVFRDIDGAAVWCDVRRPPPTRPAPRSRASRSTTR
jgi:hypothetical protein